MTAALDLHLTNEEKARLQKRGTENPEAWRLYESGVYFWRKAEENGWSEKWLEKAAEGYQRAMELDQKFAAAYAGLAHSILSRSTLPNDLLLKARQTAAKALELDDGLPQAHLALAALKISLVSDLDWAGAEAEYKRALALNPNDSFTRDVYAMFLSFTGEAEEPLAQHRKALELDPLSPVAKGSLGFFYVCLGLWDKAIPLYQSELELKPD